ncbi:MAG: hypothetical protein Q8862_06445 [Bacteroidota bacterium]|nr:hypothetical protein [Bacteroidota bacterium]MDP4206784.1 hypothetical protein [Bacteroidota bacterium]
MKSITCYLATYLFLILIAFTNYSFSERNNFKEEQKKPISTTGNVNFNPTIDSLLHSFILKANCIDCYYEMYIDKRDENETIICLRASLKFPNGASDSKNLLKDYLKKKKAILYTKIDNVIIFIYTGIEDLITFSSFNEDIELKKNRSSYYEYTWVIRKKNSEYNVYEETWVNPFEKTEFKGIIKFNAPNSQ